MNVRKYIINEIYDTTNAIKIRTFVKQGGIVDFQKRQKVKLD